MREPRPKPICQSARHMGNRIWKRLGPYSLAGVFARIGEHKTLLACIAASHQTTRTVTVDMRSLGGALRTKERPFSDAWIFHTDTVRELLGGGDEPPFKWCGGDLRPEARGERAEYCAHDDCMRMRGIVLAKWRQLHPDGPPCLCRPRIDGSTCAHGRSWPCIKVSYFSLPVRVSRADLGEISFKPTFSWDFIYQR